MCCGLAEDSVGDGVQLVVIQAALGGREELPAQHVGTLRPGRHRTVGEEADVLREAAVGQH